jgi:two-component system, cell cycle response regulator
MNLRPMNPRPFTLLIVSPDRLMLRRLSRFLEVFGYDVLQATDSATALAAAQAARPDFLIVDASGAQGADPQIAGAVARVWPHAALYRLLLSDRQEASDVTAALEAGYDDFLAAPAVFGEVLARLRAGARRLEYERRANEASGADPLTGLAEVSSLDKEMRRRSVAAKGKVGWLGLVELDYFERFAQQHGQRAASELLRRVGASLRTQVAEGRIAAALPTGRIAVLLPASGEPGARTWCEQLLQSFGSIDVSDAFQADAAGGGSAERLLTASCGLTEVTSDETLETVLARAERGLALAKASGRGCVATSDDVEREAAEWAEYAADGKLFETTLARDVMQPCPLLLAADEGIEQAHALLLQSGLAAAPVIDADGKLAGLVSLEQLNAARPRNPRPRQSVSSSSVRLVRHVMSTDTTRFDEEMTLAELLDFFTGEDATLAIIVRNKQPRGLVHCHALAALNERLTAQQFAAAQPRTGTSADLVVPDLALAE